MFHHHHHHHHGYESPAIFSLLILTVGLCVVKAEFRHKYARSPLFVITYVLNVALVYWEARHLLTPLVLTGLAMATWAWLCVEFICGTLKARAAQFGRAFRWLYPRKPVHVPFLGGPGLFETPVSLIPPDQETLEEGVAPSPFPGEATQRQVIASLVLVEDQAQDEQAVRVDVAGAAIGYLDPEHSRAFHEKFRHPGAVFYECEALLMSLPAGPQVWLDLPRSA